MYLFFMPFVMLSLLGLLTLTSCSGATGMRGEPGVPGPTGPVGPMPIPAPAPEVDSTQQDIDFLVKDENSYRLGLGQTMLSPGLSCYVQQITSGVRISSSSPPSLGAMISTTGPTYNYLYTGSFNQPNVSGLNGLLPPHIRPLFNGLNHYILCQGQIVVRDTDWYQFDTTSDDGSILYLDGALVVNNDGAHGVATVSGTKFLRRGVHQIRVDYAQSGGGNLAMMLKSGGDFIDPKFFYH